MRFLEEARKRVLVLDGAMGTMIHAANPTLEDFAGMENCNEVLNRTRPDIIEGIHAAYFDAGADAVETNTFGCTRLLLADFGIPEEAYDLNKRGAALAKRVAERYSTPEKPRFVVGSIGPGTKLVTLDQTDYDTMFESYREQGRGLIDGGADALLIETCQDILQTKCAVAAMKQAMIDCGRKVAVMAQVTIETTGTMLLGTDMDGAITALSALGVDVMGMNCATGPQEMSQHVRTLASTFPGLVSVLPNAGLPQLVDGKAHFPLGPDELAHWIRRFIEEDGVNIVGGCCGTTPSHIAAVAKVAASVQPKRRDVKRQRRVSSLYGATRLRQDASVLMIGERTNANGSRQFKKLLEAGDIEGMVKMARSQVKEGSHVLDVCTAYVGRDESADMKAVIRRFRTDVQVPLMIDSTEAPVIEAALKLVGGKCIINSVNLEDGEERLDKILPMAKKYGAAVVALTIDEQGMAKTVERKLEIARRLYDLITKKWEMDPGDIIFDPLTFTICTGNEDDRKLGLETLHGIERIAKEFPESHTILGLSNISFGVDPELRHALNSVYMYHAQQKGLNAAIVHAAKIEPLFKIEPEVRVMCEDLIFDRRREGYDPLQKLLGHFAASGGTKKERVQVAPRTIEEKLKQRIIDGDKVGLEADIDKALGSHPALAIINDILLDGMKTVGELFGTGEMQLPFVLQSAETMKTAVAHLEPHMDRIAGESKGKIVLATVKGDVHDIGKNLVDIILTNNGYTCYNLGINQPIGAILEAVKKYQPHAVGLSGLLVKSTVIMRENLEELVRQGHGFPVILGGAALTRKYVEEDCRKAYSSGHVFYAKDSFEGLALMGGIRGPGGAEAALEALKTKRKAELEAVKATIAAVPSGKDTAVKTHAMLDRPAPEVEEPPVATEVRKDVPVPPAPFLGVKIIEELPLRAVLPFINEQMLFNFQWQYRRQGRSAEEFEAFVRDEVRPVLRRIVDEIDGKGVIMPKAAYGYFPCYSEGDDLVVLDPKSKAEIERFTFPRQRSKKRLCIADFFRSKESGEHDIVGFTAVTIGQNASDVERAWFAANRYTDYFHLHGLAVESAEALAEYIHKQIRAELGIASEDARDMRDIFRQRYHGSRYSFGYPACPRLEDQTKILKLLGADRIGISLSEEFQLHPEQSTTAVVCHHPQAKYFSI